MIAHKHYDPDKVSTHMADKSTARLVISLATAKKLSIKHIDIKCAFPHEDADPNYPIFVKKLPRFDGTLKQDSQYGKLKLNLYGSVAAAFIYFEGVTSHLIQHGYSRSEHDPCLFYRIYPKGSFIIIYINLEDFLKTASSNEIVQKMVKILSSKYDIRDLGESTNFLN